MKKFTIVETVESTYEDPIYQVTQIISDNEFRINYGDTDNLHNLPTFASLNHSTDDYHVEIEIHEYSNEMFCEIWVKDKLVELTDMQLDYIINMKKTKVYQKKFQLIGEFDTLKEAKELIKEIKTTENINTNKDFKIK